MAVAPAPAHLDRRGLKLLAQQMSKALRDSQGGGLMERFEAVSKLLFTKIADERRAAGEWLGLATRPPEVGWRAGDTERTVYERTRRVWQEATSGLADIFAGPRGHFPSDVAAVARIVRLMDGLSLTAVSDDVKGAVYEELLKNTFEKNENQQYFTPRNIVDFIVDAADPAPGSSVCDPACGSGGFLVGALLTLRARHSDVPPILRGAEIDERMAWVARINILMHGGDPRSVHTLLGAGSLARLDTISRALPATSFDLILTNPPFGSDMTDREALRSLRTGSGRASRRRGVLFVERCLDLLKIGGRLAIVLDDSVLNLPANRDVRELVRERAIVEAVVSLPDVTFMPYSTAKSSILFLRRPAAGEHQGSVFMADVEHVGVRPNGDPLYADENGADGARHLKSDLPLVLDHLRDFRLGHPVDRSSEGTSIFAADIDRDDNADARLDVYFFHPARREAEASLSRSAHHLAELGDLFDIDGTATRPSEEFGDSSVHWIGLGDIDAHTGRYEVREVPGDRVKSTAHVFRSGDILYSRLRPKLRKAVLISHDDDGGICSSELLVLRTKESARSVVLDDYVAYLLRSDLVFGQLIYQVTGVGRPRVTAQAVKRVRIPLPPVEEQRRLADELHRADEGAREMRTAARRNEVLADDRMSAAYASVVAALIARS